MKNKTNKKFYFLLLALFTSFSLSAQFDVRPVTEKKAATNPLDDAALTYIFDKNALPEIRLDITEDQWNELLLAYDQDPNTNYYIKGDFTFTKNSVVTSIPEVGIRLRGNTSRRRPEGSTGELHNPQNPEWHHASFTINFTKYNDDTTFMDEEKLILKWAKDDSTYVCETYSYDLYKQYELYVTPFTSYTRLTINIIGDPKPAYYGVYELIEQVDDIFLSKRTEVFGDAKGYLWKNNYGGTLADPDTTLMGVSTDDHEYIYDLQTHKKQVETARAQLSQFITDFNTKQGTEFQTWLEETLDVELLLKTYAVNVMVGNWDDYWVNKNNYYIYFNKNDGKFFFIPWDLDNTLGTSSILDDSGRQDVLNWGNAEHPLIQKIISFPAYQTIYLNALYELADPDKDLFYYEKSIARIQKWQDLIRDYVDNDTNEDTKLGDAPAWWGNQPEYRLLTTPNNYFQVKVQSLPPRP
ncbi:MAG: CotH kinase family protein [Bacteroides sp.]|nr:CotH kinase family protein [Bacteroides sp.]